MMGRGSRRGHGRAAILAAAGALAAGAAVAEPPALPAPAPSFAGQGAFDGAALGMSLADWRALPFPGRADPHVRVVCEAAGAGAQECRYADLYGRIELPLALPLDPGGLAWRVRYRFQDGRLAAISFRASVDDYSAMMAGLDRIYGKPAQTQAGKTQAGRASGARFGRAQVRQSWRGPRDQVDLIDPSPNPARLEVRLSLASPA